MSSKFKNHIHKQICIIMLNKITFFVLLAQQIFAQTIYTSLEEALKNSQSAEVLTLSGIQDLDIKKIGQLKNLRVLEITACNLTNVPASIQKISRLEVLNLSNNQLSILPKQIGELKSLRSLKIAANKFSLLPPEISELINLEELYLSDNQLTDLPVGVEKLSKLKTLQIKGNNFDNGVPNVLTNLTQIEKLELTLQANMGKGMNAIAQIKNLNELKLVCAYNVETLPLEITKLRGLETLSIANIPHVFNWEKSMTFLSLLPGFKNLILSGNNLKSLDQSIEKLYLNLETLDLSNNQLSELPEGFYRLNNLKKISLADNPLPEETKERIKAVYPQVEVVF